MSPVSDIKTKVQALEAEGKIPEALALLQDALARLEGTPGFLKELPLLVKVGDFETRLGNTAAALTCYERAIAAYIRHGRANSVIATALRIARLRPDPGPFFDYALQLKGFGHVDAARRVLMDTARRTGHPVEAEELEFLAGAPDADIVAAVDRIVGAVSGRVATKRPSRAMSLEEAIVAMRRKSGLVERPPLEPELPPPPPAPVQKARRLVPALLVAALVVAVGGLVWTFYQAPNLAGPPLALEQSAPVPDPVAPSPPVAAAETRRTQVERGVAARPMPGVGLLAADSSNVAVLPWAPEADRSLAIGDTSPIVTVPSDVPRLPAGALVTRSVVAVRGLSISRIEDAGRGYRLIQPLSDLTNLELTLSPASETGVFEPAVTAVQGGAIGTMRFLGYLVSARAPVAADSLHRLLLRLVEVPPRQ